MKVLAGHLYSHFDSPSFIAFKNRIDNLKEVYDSTNEDEFTDFIYVVITDSELISIVENNPLDFHSEVEDIYIQTISDEFVWTIVEDVYTNTITPKSLNSKRRF